MRANLARSLAEVIADHERMQRENVVLRRRFALAELEERRQVAQELHDRTAQQLTALSLGLHALSELAPPGSEMERRAAQLRLLANTMGQELHEIAVRLRSGALDDFGLAPAIRAYASSWSRQTGIALELHVRLGESRLSREVETGVYRIIREALTDVASSSGARGASVVLERRLGALCVAIAHDGSGLETSGLSARENKAGLRLPGIRERAALLGGSIDVESAPGAGTCISIHIPVDDMSLETEPSIGGERRA